MSIETDLTAPRVGCDRRSEVLAIALTLAGLALAVWMIAQSDGFYHDDDLGHYNFARDAWHDSTALWHVWARPGYNVPVTLVAHYFGMAGCRILSALLTAGAAFLAFRIAKLLGAKLAWVAPALVWAQPLAMTLSLTTLTETPALFYLTLAVWLYMRGNRVWGCAALSCLFVTRYETPALAPIFAGFVIYDALKAADWKILKAVRTWWAWACAGALVWAPVFWVAASVYCHLQGNNSVVHMFDKKYTNEYGHGEWFRFLLYWPLVSTLGILALAAGGIFQNHRKAILPAAMGIALVALESVIFWKGAFESGGYPRFLVPACGLVGAMAATGLSAVVLSGASVGVAEAIFLVLAVTAGKLNELKVWLYSFINAESQAWAVGMVSFLIRNGNEIAMWLFVAAFVTFLCSMFGNLTNKGATNMARRVLGIGAGALALLVVAGQVGLQAQQSVWSDIRVGPLKLSQSPLNSVIDQCVKDLQASPYAKSHGYTNHVLVNFLLPQTIEVGYSTTDSKKRWLNAAPGTVFLWDNKYAQAKIEDDDQPLYYYLNLHGRILFSHVEGDYAAVVYIRLDDRDRPAQPPVTDAAPESVPDLVPSGK
jgi:hypothetical protein